MVECVMFFGGQAEAKEREEREVREQFAGLFGEGFDLGLEICTKTMCESQMFEKNDTNFLIEHRREIGLMVKKYRN